MNIVILGASGRTGRLVVENAVARAHRVTALVRSASSLAPSELLRVTVGDPTTVADVTRVVRDQDVVISCLGQRSAGDAMLLGSAAAATIQAMQATDVSRFLVVSQGLLFPSRNPIITILKLVFARQIADSARMEEQVRRSDLDWTVVRPPRLLEGGTPQGYRIAIDARPAGPASMQRADLASCLVDAAERRELVRRMVGVTAG
jgi:putative NADH-flavin reductase